MKTNINKNQIKLPGGTTGQALVKSSNSDFDYDWGTGSGNIIDINGGMPFTMKSWATNSGTPSTSININMILNGSVFGLQTTSGYISSASYVINRHTKFGLTAGNIIPVVGLDSQAQGHCYDYILNKLFVLSANGFTSNIILRQYDPETMALEYTWTCSGSAPGLPPIWANTYLTKPVVDKADLKLYLTGFDSSCSVDGVAMTPGSTYIFDLSSPTGGTIISSGTSFSGANAFTHTGSECQINSTTKKFFTVQDTGVTSFSPATGKTGFTAFPDLTQGVTGAAVVWDNKLFYNRIVESGFYTNGITTSTTYFFETTYYPDSDTVLFT